MMLCANLWDSSIFAVDNLKNEHRTSKALTHQKSTTIKHIKNAQHYQAHQTPTNTSNIINFHLRQNESIWSYR
jgi:hypothetical protein